MKILVTGFEPFGSDAENPTLLAVNALPETLAGARILKRILPVSFQAAQRMVRAAVAQEGVDAAVLTGLAGGRAKISLERVAINMQDARMPDNDGDCPVDLPIRAEGPAAYFATLPLRHIQAGLQDAGIPVEISNSAGTYVCNLAMYCALDEIALLGLRAGRLYPRAISATTSPGAWRARHAAGRNRARAYHGAGNSRARRRLNGHLLLGDSKNQAQGQLSLPCAWFCLIEGAKRFSPYCANWLMYSASYLPCRAISSS